MKKTRKRRLAVCLLSPHVLALDSFKRYLPPGEFRVHSQTLAPLLAADPQQLRLPRAEVYLLDGATAWPAAATLVAAIEDHHPRGRLVVVGENFNETTAFPLLRLGVKGLLHYADVPKRLGLAVKGVAAGGFWVPRDLLSRFVDWVLSRVRVRSLPAGSPGLSAREKDVLEALLANLANKEIASKLNISERTVKFHVSNVLAKFGVRRRADLIVLSYQGGVAGH